MRAKFRNWTLIGSALEPWVLGLQAAWALMRQRGPWHVARLGLAGFRTLGPKGLVYRAASTPRQQEEDLRYQQWLAVHEPSAEERLRLAEDIVRLRYRPSISLIVPVFNTDPRLLRRCLETVRDQIYPVWELCICDDGSTNPDTVAVLESFRSDSRVRAVRSGANRGIVHASNAALALATGDFIAFLDHDDELTPDALAEIARRLESEPDLDVVYSDEDKIDDAGTRREPHFKPDFSPALLRSCMYTSHLTVMRRRRLIEVGGLRDAYEGAQDYDLMLRVAERTPRIGHVPKVLYHWRATPDSAASSQLSKPWAIAAIRAALEDHVRRAGVHAVVLPTKAAGHFRIRYEVRGAPRVSILVAVAGVSGGDQRLSHLAAIARATKYSSIEFAIACESTLSDGARRVLGAIAHRLVVTGAASLPVQLNAAARAAQGEHLLTLDADAEPVGGDWLDALLELSQQDAVGAVGAFLLTPDRTIDHAGLVVGVGAGVAAALQGEPEWTRGHLGTAGDVRNCSAVSGACLMTRRAVFERVGGFDERLPALFDVDYGLRVRKAGLEVVITPHARIRSSATSARIGAAPAADIERLRLVWGAAAERDPYYNPHFDRQAATFRLPAAAPRPLDVEV